MSDFQTQIDLSQQQIDQRQHQIDLRQKQIELHKQQLDDAEKHLQNNRTKITEQQRYIALLEEYLRLAKAQKYGPSSEKLAFQGDLFDEAELEVTLSELEAELHEEDHVRPKSKTRQRGFSPSLARVRIELTLSEDEKAGAARTFFTKVKEELEFIPAKLQVLEYWQERAVFEQANGEDTLLSAQRPVHPLGKCFASITLLAQIIIGKYADGLPLYRQEAQFKRYGADLSRSVMAAWVVRLGHLINPLIDMIRHTQNTGDYLQGDETRIQVLKEPGRAAQSDKWMWVMRGGPPGKEAVLFEYDPSRAGAVPVRLLDGFSGVLQCDGYSGYGRV